MFLEAIRDALLFSAFILSPYLACVLLRVLLEVAQNWPAFIQRTWRGVLNALRRRKRRVAARYGR